VTAEDFVESYRRVLLPATAFPALLDDGPRFRRTKQILLLLLIPVALAGVDSAIPNLMRNVMAATQNRICDNAALLLSPAATLDKLQEQLAIQCTFYDMPETRAIIGRSTIDVLGHEQAVALFNHFNYHPRPVFQSYSAYRPYLSRLNADFYASSRAPDYVLVKLDTIDRRLATFDDAEVLHLLLHRYEYVHSEKGFQLWHRRPGPFATAAIAPRPLVELHTQLGRALPTEKYSGRPLWAEIEVRPSLLGRLRGFFYKLPIVNLRIENTRNVVTEYRMPLPMGRTGFIINPVVEDLISYMQFAGVKPDRFLRNLTVSVAPEDRIYFDEDVTVRLSTLPPSTAGQEYFRQADKRLFHMFNVVPTDYNAQTPLSEGRIDDRPVTVFHAPSTMNILVPKGATEFTGEYGFMPGAYTNNGNTDGAGFIITWVLGAEEIILLERYLDPVHKLGDRGLQTFRLALPSNTGGHLRLRTDPGPKNNFSWDWTAWGGLTFN